jgi:hypothetical protein
MSETSQVREAVAVFGSEKDLEAAIDELLSSGFSRAELSLLASSETVHKRLGHFYLTTRDLEDDPKVPVAAYVPRESVGEAEGAMIGGLLYVGAFLGLGPVVASGGPIGMAVLAAVLGGGGGTAIGALLARWIGQHHADYLDDQLRHGGILLWVRTRDTEHEERARKILARHSGRDVHVHGIPDHSGDLEAYYAGPPSSETVPVERMTYHDTEILRAEDGHCFAMGRVFATEADAKRYIVAAESEA